MTTPEDWKVPIAWRVQQIVRDYVPPNREFPASLVTGLLYTLFDIDRNAAPYLDNMQCTEPLPVVVKKKTKKPYGSRLYKRKFKANTTNCDGCPQANCLILHTKMAQQLGLDKNLKELNNIALL